ncbi:protein of unknown function [Xenorhabdus bovienii]|uniref:Uncharacterized protein n=1 Tax=Xenorhabdus bovienii TaxID=40576 RepID=A0A0B6X6A4_XENBV|nr:protein of unknown function [Xenorhabdus bovienii]
MILHQILYVFTSKRQVALFGISGGLDSLPPEIKNPALGEA